MIPEENNAEFVCQMEEVLAVYQRPYDPLHPVVCMDESPSQLIGEARSPFRDSKGVEHVDYEYRRNGTVSIFAALEPLAGRRMIQVKDSHKAEDWVDFMRDLEAQYPQVETITVVLDNLSIHKKAHFYKFIEPAQARALVEKFRFVYTPVHGSWLNIAEIELRMLKQQCLARRMPDKQTIEDQIKAWATDKNNKQVKVDWQFSIDQARTKLKRLYPRFLDLSQH